jgi:hypothetical protein
MRKAGFWIVNLEKVSGRAPISTMSQEGVSCLICSVRVTRLSLGGVVDSMLLPEGLMFPWLEGIRVLIRKTPMLVLGHFSTSS